MNRNMNLADNYRKKLTVVVSAFFLAIYIILPVKAEDIQLQGLIDQAIKVNPEIQAAEARISAAEFRVPQAKALPDPQVTLGYQDDQFGEPTLGDRELSWIVVQGSQTFPFFGKRALRGNIAKHEVMGLQAELQGLKLQTASRVKELYYDLFLAYKNLDIIQSRADLFTRMENAALSRYSTGMGQQQDVLSAQTEKYNLLTQEEQWKQKIKTDEAQLNALLGRESTTPIGKPDELAITPLKYSLEELIQIAYQNSPEIMARQKTVAQQGMREKLARRESYPDFTINGGVFPRGGEFTTMWSLTTTFNLPIYYFQKQKNAIKEAQSTSTEMRFDLENARLQLSSDISIDYSTITAADRLLRIYKSGLISKTVQDYELALTGYATGKNDALTVTNTLRNLVDYETSYWEQIVEREKAVARLESLIACNLDAGSKAAPTVSPTSPQK